MTKDTETTEFRPRFHYAPARNWMNDPNGLVYLNGEYHLFYQHNPTASEWGNIGWAHAVSRDLLHWQDLGEALPATECGMNFSGSGVVDHRNTSGLADGSSPAIVAIFTRHSPTNGDPRQAQHVAWSVDGGRSWNHYAGNPVLDIGSDGFRDPKVFWHADTGKWIMLVVLADEHVVQFYGSPDLLQWEFLSSFGPRGNIEGEWECPDLFPLSTIDEPGCTRWILKIDNTLGAVAGGSGAQYFVGEFDGSRFHPDTAAAGDDETRDGARPVDYGSDFYAAMSWSDVPAADGRRLWLGWMSNWRYADATPTYPWRGVQSFPRSLRLVACGDTLRLAQQPVDELRQLRSRHECWNDVELAAGQSLSLTGSDSETLELAVRAMMGSDAVLALRIGRSTGSVTVVRCDTGSNELSVDRRAAAAEAFHPDFPACHRAPLRVTGGLVTIRLLLDHCCLEVFGGRGESVITDLVFPDGTAGGIRVECERGSVVVRQLDLWLLRD